jgi:signal transduction histidine kinase
VVEVVVAFASGAAWFALTTVLLAAGLPDTPPTAIAVVLVSLAVIGVVARYWSVASAVTIGVASAVALDWYWIPPTHAAEVPDGRNALALGVYLATATLLGELAVRTSRRAVAADLARAALADEQAALRRVATLVARGAAPEAVFASVTEEVARLLEVDVAALLRYESDGSASILAAWRDGRPYDPRERRLDLAGENVAAEVRRTGRATSTDGGPTGTGPLADTLRELGVRSLAASPVTVGGSPWGVVLVAWTSARASSDVEGRRLHEFTALTGTAIANAQNLTELVASRTRIVTAADQARRHIERDLHDGVQQHLVALALRLRLASDDAAATELAEELRGIHDGVLTTLEELREISHGIHPAILSDGGLRPALANLGRRSPVPVEVTARVEERLPEPVEVGLYYVVSETLTNAVKHADASLVLVDLDVDPSQIRLVVRDDGVGGADQGAGSGLIGLQDRVHALGGTLVLTSPPGDGTTVEVTIPRGSPTLRAEDDESAAATRVPRSA